ncbi:MAG: precorrin-4 C(11)-methyltransferase [Bacillota bacterium]
MIYFVGAGPGDPDLITVKAARILGEADLVIFAGSLVNPAVLEYTRPGTILVDSASLDLGEIIDRMTEAYQRGLKVVRLHSGDPSLYGAIGEQMRELDRLDIPYQVIPGVSSFLAAAASLSKEYTVPDGSQTVIITRLAGRTPVIVEQRLGDLAKHQAALCVFLSVHMIEQVEAELIKGYSPDTPVAVVERASWPEEMVIRGVLKDLSSLVREAGITRTALILVGDFLTAGGQSRLYDAGFAHGYRQPVE